MNLMRKSFQILCACAVAIAFVWSWLFALSFATSLTRYCTRNDYRAETFVVTSAEYVAARKSPTEYWLWGEISGRGERLVPTLPRGLRPRNKEDLLSLFPKGTTLPVLYNPGASDVTIQGETLRVISSSPNVWQEEAWTCLWLGRQVLIPVPLTLCIFFAVRANNRRHSRLLATKLSH